MGEDSRSRQAASPASAGTPRTRFRKATLGGSRSNTTPIQTQTSQQLIPLDASHGMAAAWIPICTGRDPMVLIEKLPSPYFSQPME